MPFLTRLSTGVGKGVSILAFAVVFPLVLCMALSLMGLPVKGFEWLHSEEEAPVAVAKPAVTVVDFTATPANRAMGATFKDLDKTWTPSSSPVTSAGLPHPMSCVKPAPTLSDSRSYTDGNRETQVTIAAYPAGLGGEMYRRLLTDTYTCKPSSTSVYISGQTGLGAEAATMDTAWGNNNIETTFFRRGDVIVFVATDQNVDSYVNAQMVDSILQRHLTTMVCPDQSQGAKAQYRNAFFAGPAFTGAVRNEPLKTKKLKKPGLTEDQRSQGVEKVSIPASPVQLEPVSLPSSDYPYPLWPPLPGQKPIPGMPNEPKKQRLTDNAEVRVQDPVGPGCGWAFLTTVEPTFDEEQVQANNTAIVAAVQTALDADGPRWQEDVRKYWTAYDEYLAKVYAYQQYEDEVAEVAAAWNLIHQAWDEYYTAYANWEIKEAARLQFIADQEAARELLKAQREACRTFPEVQAQYEADYAQWQLDYAAWETENAQYQQTVAQYQQDLAAYNAAVAQYRADMREYRKLKAQYEADLAAWEQADPATRGPEPIPPTKPTKPTKPTPPPPGPVAPVEPTQPVLDHPCPPVKPAILSQEPPKQTPPPEKPEDPRPASVRN